MTEFIELGSATEGFNAFIHVPADTAMEVMLEIDCAGKRIPIKGAIAINISDGKVYVT